MATESGESHGFENRRAEHLRVLGAVITITLDSESTGDTVTVTEIDAPPGYENGLHTHPPDELFYVLDGEMTLYLDEEPHRLTPGTTGFVPGDAPHGFRVEGTDPLRTLAIFTPAGMDGFFRAVGEPVETRAVPERAKVTDAEWEAVLAASPTYGMRRLGPLPPAE